jgi:L-galactose dehydrogenase
VHDPEFAPSLEIILHETLPALHKLKEQGVVRHVGITGYPLSVLRRLLEESPVPISTCLSYCHHTINDTTLVPQLLPLLQTKGVGLVNASPLSMGLLTTRGPPAWHPAHAHQKKVCREVRVEWRMCRYVYIL